VVALRSLVVPLVVGTLSALLLFGLSEHLINATYDYGFFRCLYGFFVGHFVFRIWKSGRVALRQPTAVELGIIVLGFVLVATLGRTSWSYACPLLFGVVVWVFAHEKGAASRIMESRPLTLLGTWSYSIYMVHAVVLVVLNRGLVVLEKLVDQPLITVGPSLDGTSLRQLISFGGPWVMDALAIAYLVAVVFAASLTYKYIEVPGREFFNRLAARNWQPAT
jgi:peptidoglycan/LPS O-acetylase OafA/YrhL